MKVVDSKLIISLDQEPRLLSDYPLLEIGDFVDKVAEQYHKVTNLQMKNSIKNTYNALAKEYNRRAGQKVFKENLIDK